MILDVMRDGDSTDTGSYIYVSWDAPSDDMAWTYKLYSDSTLVLETTELETHDIFQSWESTIEYKVLAVSPSGGNAGTAITTYHLGTNPGTLFSSDAKELFWAWLTYID